MSWNRKPEDDYYKAKPEKPRGFSGIDGEKATGCCLRSIFESAYCCWSPLLAVAVIVLLIILAAAR